MKRKKAKEIIEHLFIIKEYTPTKYFYLSKHIKKEKDIFILANAIKELSSMKDEIVNTLANLFIIALSVYNYHYKIYNFYDILSYINQISQDISQIPNSKYAPNQEMATAIENFLSAEDSCQYASYVFFEKIKEKYNILFGLVENIPTEDTQTEENIVTEIKKHINNPEFYANFDKYVAERVLGQENISKLTLNIYMWLRGIASGNKNKNNIILTAPSGSGKTETYRVLKEYFQNNINIPVIQLDSTKLTSEGYSGLDTIDFFEPLFSSENGIAIVFLDEIDKRLIPDYCNGRNINENIQSQLLTIIEGTELTNNDSKTIDTTNTLFIGTGAFSFLYDDEKINSPKTPIGFIHEKKLEENKLEEKKTIDMEDILKYGATNEFLGRFATIINYDKLEKNNIKKIIEKYKTDYELQLNYKIKIQDSFLDKMYQMYNETPFGCRMLRSEMWNQITDKMIDIEKNKNNDTKKIIILEK